MIAHSYVYEYPYYNQRFNDIVATYNDEPLMIETAKDLQADYILAPNNKLNADTLPTVYQNDEFTIYQLP